MVIDLSRYAQVEIGALEMYVESKHVRDAESQRHVILHRHTRSVVSAAKPHTRHFPTTCCATRSRILHCARVEYCERECEVRRWSTRSRERRVGATK